MTPYAVRSVDLSIGPQTTTLIGGGTSVTSFLVQTFPGGTSFIRLGLTGENIPVTEGMRWEYDPCKFPNGETEGVYWVQPAAGAGTAVVVIFTAGAVV